MRKYLMIGMMLVSSAAIFIALHKYVEISLMTVAQAQAADAPVVDAGQTDATECGTGECYPHSDGVDLMANTNLTREQIVAKALKKKLKKSSKEGHQ